MSLALAVAFFKDERFSFDSSAKLLPIVKISEITLSQKWSNVVLTLKQRCLDFSNVITTLKQRRVLTGLKTVRTKKVEKENQENNSSIDNILMRYNTDYITFIYKMI